jgi:DNA (cytosine-5)-methyltransferase 1
LQSIFIPTVQDYESPPLNIGFMEQKAPYILDDSPRLNVASFFSGIGGFDLAFEQVGANVVFQCERDAFCQKVLRKHWPDVPLATDINVLTPEAIPHADIWCGGFPCQDLSLANQGKRKGIEGARSGLFTQFAGLAEPLRPKWLLLENVPGLLNSGNGADFKYVLQTLDDLGYFVVNWA